MRTRRVQILGESFGQAVANASVMIAL